MVMGRDWQWRLGHRLVASHRLSSQWPRAQEGPLVRFRRASLKVANQPETYSGPTGMSGLQAKAEV